MEHRHIRRTYLTEATYFVTTDVRWHRPFFADPNIAKICEANMWNTFRIQRCDVFAYVIMLDHLHLLVQVKRTNISEIMRSVKTNASRDVNRYLHAAVPVPHSASPGTRAMGTEGGRFSWQEKFYDHIIIDERDFRNHVEYTRYNPIRAGLVERPEDYPFLFVDWDAIRSLFGGS